MPSCTSTPASADGDGEAAIEVATPTWAPIDPRGQRDRPRSGLDSPCSPSSTPKGHDAQAWGAVWHDIGSKTLETSPRPRAGSSGTSTRTRSGRSRRPREVGVALSWHAARPVTAARRDSRRVSCCSKQRCSSSPIRCQELMSERGVREDSDGSCRDRDGSAQAVGDDRGPRRAGGAARGRGRIGTTAGVRRLASALRTGSG
jgi:hypothetical protein